MKKVSILILSIALILALALIGKGPVKAKTDAYIDTKVETNIPDSANGNGCFISFYDWFNEPNDYINFLKLAFNISSNDFIQVLLEGAKKAQNMGYIDENGVPCVLYISSEELLNKWLRDNAYIEYGASYKEGITGVNLSNGLHYAKTGYDALHELLQLKGELQAYVLDPDDVPEVFVRKNAEASTYTDKWYIFSDLKKPYIINGTWQYKVLEYDGPVEECTVVDLPNSVGKVKQVSNSTYEYVYSEVYYNDEFGYYSLSQSDTKIMQLIKNQLPSFIFDTNGKIKDIYISKQSNLWTCPEVKDTSNEMKFKWTYESKIPLNSVSGTSSTSLYYEIYFNFELPVDTIEYIQFNLPMIKNNKFLWWTISIEKYDFFKMTVRRGDKADLTESDFYNWFLRNVSKMDTSYSIIEKGPYITSNGKKYLFKITYVDDYYSSYVEEGFGGIVKWGEKELVKSPTKFSKNIFPSSEDELLADVVYSYRSILYKINDVSGVFEKPANYPDDDTFWDWIWKMIVELWNSNLFGKIVLVLITCLLSFPIISFLVFIIKSLYRLFNNIKNKKSTV